jgi:hypothetical protein
MKMPCASLEFRKIKIKNKKKQHAEICAGDFLILKNEFFS